MRFLFFLMTMGSFGYGIWWVSSTHPEIKSKFESMLPISDFRTLEIRYSANQIMEAHRKELLKDGRHRYLEAQLCFYPYLLMEVKYAVNPKKTQEGLILWDLSDGEMVIETKGWNKTHGFGDCILGNTDSYEFKVIRTLAKKGGICDREFLSKKLHVESDVLDALVERLREKKLIVQSGNHYRLHLQKPMLKVAPSTKMEERLVTKTWKHAHKVSKRFSLSQIEKISKAAFGRDFAIRHTTDVYLPVHSISVQNPDGSTHTSLWNALNGKRILYSHARD